MTLYRLKEVTRVFGGRTVLDVAELAIEDRKIHAVLGANGAGKTTLLQLLAFLDRPSSGELFYLGEPVRYAHPRLQRLRREVVMVEQFPIMFTGSVRRNVEFGLKIRGLSRDRREPVIEEALEMVGMRKFAAAAAHRLSGGETQRVALARALALSPRVFLCDEPTANVDVEHQAVIVDILQRINAEKKITVIFASHDRYQARRLAHNTLVLDHGRIVPTLYENVFSGRILSRGATHIHCALGDRSLAAAVQGTARNPSSKARIVIDAGMISIGDTLEGADAGPNVFQGAVAALSAENGHIRVLADVGFALNVLVEMDTYSRRPLTIGQKVWVAIPPEAVTLFE